VKGETHDLTVFVCPDPDQASRCPSVVWWSDAAEHQEERRIAFVAVTRTRGHLIVCVSAQCLARLRETRADFVKSFECMSIDDFIAKDGDYLSQDASD
jgi:superfamily I DNA/RNA helicase